jgi:hypothetical protein
MKGSYRRLCVAAWVLCVLCGVSWPVWGKDEPSEETKACLTAYDKAQDLRAEGKLRAAKEQAIACSRGECPEALLKDCRDWLDQITQSIPSVVFDVRDDQGEFVANAKIYVDDELIAEKLEGRAIEVDPGAHRIRAQAEGYKSNELKVVIQEGQRARSIAIVLARPAQKKMVPDARDEDEVPIATWVFGGLAVAGVAVGAIFLGLGLDKRGELDACRPACVGEDVDDMMMKLVVSDVAFSAALVAGAAALTFYLTRPTASGSAKAALVVTPMGGVLQSMF